MRYHITSAARPKAVARDLKSELAEAGQPRSYMTCLDLVSQMYGYRNWQECERLIGSTPASPDDVALDQESAAARFEQHVEVLHKSGVPGDIAQHIIWRVRPTARQQRVEVAPDHILARALTKPGGVTHALRQAAVYLARTGRDVLVERHQKQHLWHLISWSPPIARESLRRIPERRVIAIRDDGKYLEACRTYAGTRSGVFSDLSDATSMVGGNVLSSVLAEIGYPGLALYDHPASDTLAKTLEAVFARIDHETLQVLAPQIHFDAESYRIIAALSREPGRLFELLRETPILSAGVIDACHHRDEDRGKKIYEAIDDDLPIRNGDGPLKIGPVKIATSPALTKAVDVRLHRPVHFADLWILRDMPEEALPSHPYDVTAMLCSAAGARELTGCGWIAHRISRGLKGNQWNLYRYAFPKTVHEEEAQQSLIEIVQRHLGVVHIADAEMFSDDEWGDMVIAYARSLAIHALNAFGLPDLLERVARYQAARERSYDRPLNAEEAIHARVEQERMVFPDDLHDLSSADLLKALRTHETLFENIKIETVEELVVPIKLPHLEEPYEGHMEDVLLSSTLEENTPWKG
jgi:hypothetical protein